MEKTSPCLRLLALELIYLHHGYICYAPTAPPRTFGTNLDSIMVILPAIFINDPHIRTTPFGDISRSGISNYQAILIEYFWPNHVNPIGLRIIAVVKKVHSHALPRLRISNFVSQVNFILHDEIWRSSSSLFVWYVLFHHKVLTPCSGANRSAA